MATSEQDRAIFLIDRVTDNCKGAAIGDRDAMKALLSTVVPSGSDEDQAVRAETLQHLRPGEISAVFFVHHHLFRLNQILDAKFGGSIPWENPDLNELFLNVARGTLTFVGYKDKEWLNLTEMIFKADSAYIRLFQAASKR